MNYNKSNMAAAIGVSEATLMIYVKSKIVRPPQKINIPSKDFRLLWTDADLKHARSSVARYNVLKEKKRKKIPTPPSQTTTDLLNKVFK